MHCQHDDSSKRAKNLQPTRKLVAWSRRMALATAAATGALQSLFRGTTNMMKTRAYHCGLSDTHCMANEPHGRTERPTSFDVLLLFRQRRIGRRELGEGTRRGCHHHKGINPPGLRNVPCSNRRSSLILDHHHILLFLLLLPLPPLPHRPTSKTAQPRSSSGAVPSGNQYKVWSWLVGRASYNMTSH